MQHVGGLALGANHRLCEPDLEDYVVGQVAQNFLVKGLFAFLVNILNNLIWVGARRLHDEHFGLVFEVRLDHP